MLGTKLRVLLILITFCVFAKGSPASAEVRTSTFNSSYDTKVTQNTLQNVGLSVLPNSAWLNYNFTGDFLWNNVTVYNVSNVPSWEAASNLLVNFDPSTGNPPPNINNQFAFLNENYAGVIGLGSDYQKPNEARYFYRAKYQLPSDAQQIISAHLYVTSDNLANAWINGNPVGPEQPGSTINYGCPGTFEGRWLTAMVKGGVSYFDVTSSFNINTKNYLLGFNVMNAFPCEGSHPSGLQFFLVVKYDTEPSSVNQPPVCTTDPVVKDPNKEFYAPFEVINLIPKAYDPEGNNIVITNWFTQNIGGAFTDLSNLNSVYYRSPPTGGVTDTISYIASDGELTTTCSFEIQTKTAFSCLYDQCYLDSQGIYNDYTACMLECDPNFNSKFTCNSDYQCVVDDSGEYLNFDSCSTNCKAPASDVACAQIKYTDNGESLTLSALVNNFSQNEVPYSWNSSYSNANFTVPNDNFECTNAQSCFMKLLNTSYTTPQVEYQKPPTGQTDTITMRVNNNPSDLCTIYICEDGQVCENNNLSKNIDMAFNRSTYTLDASTSLTPNAKLSFITKNFNPQDTYTINLSCSNPDIDCNFTANNSKLYFASLDDLKNGLDVSITSTGTTSSTSTISANGYLSTDILVRSASAEIVVNALNTVNYRFLDVGSNTQSIANGKNFHCENNTALNPFTSTGQLRVSLDKVTFDNFESVFNGTASAILNNSNATNLRNSLYLFSTDDTLLQQNQADPKEVYCVRSETDSGEVRTGPSRIGFDLNEFNNSATVTVVVGPKLSEGWFTAFGGSAYALGDFISDVPVGKRIMQGYSNIMQGFGVVSGILGYGDFYGLDGSRKPEKFIQNYSKVLSMEQFKNKFDKSFGVNPNSVDSLSSIPTSSTVTNFYFHEGDFTIDQNFVVDSGASVPVLYVKSHETKGPGNVIITKDVNNLDLVLVADGNVTIEANKEVCVPQVNELSVDQPDFLMHVFRRHVGGGSYVEVVGGGPDRGDVNVGQDQSFGVDYSISTFEFTKPTDAEYVVVEGFWVQSGTHQQINEKSRFDFTTDDGNKSISCPDFDLDMNPAVSGTRDFGSYTITYPNDLHKSYSCGTAEGSFTGNTLVISPKFDGLLETCTNGSLGSNECKESSLADVKVSWYKYDPSAVPPEQCTTDKNLIVRGGIISKGTNDGGIIMSSSRLDEVYNEPTEEFYFRPEIYFSTDSSSDFFKENNIFLRKLD